MTRREALGALLLMFLLLTGGLAWLFGAIGLIAAALLGGAAVLFGFQKAEEVSPGRAVDVPDTVPDALLEAYGRDLPL